MSTSKLFGKDILITSTTNASGTTIGSISTLGGMNVNQTMLVSGALTSTADSNTIGNLFTTGGNVGFGTTAPVQRLDVNGNLNITGNFFQNGSVYSGSTQWGSTGANIYFNAGNVGIGTLAPSTKLHLRDTGSVTVLIEADSDNVNENDVATLQFIQDGGAVGMDIGINNSNGSYINYNTGSTATGNNFGILDRGQARLHIDSNGDIGISTTSPHAKLTIITTGSLSLTSDGFDTGKIMFGSVVSGAYNTNHRYYIQRGGTTGNMNHLIIHTPNEASNGGVNFMTTNQVSRLFINSSSGNVGIGKTAPSSALDVVGNILSTGSIDAGTQFLGQALDSSTGPSYSWTGDTNTGIYRPLADTLGFVTNSTERIRVTSSGNVGIGTTAPSSRLSVVGSETTSNGENAGIMIQNTAATSGNKWYLRTGAVGTTTPVGGFSIANNSLYRMVFTSTGNIAIGGITNPATNLHINTSNYAGIQLGNNDSSGWTVAKETGGLLAFYTGAFGAGTFRFGCTSTGNVGIGLASPLYPLHVNGSANTGNVGSYAGYYNVYGWQNQTAVYATSIYTSHFIVAGQGFASLSDTRIKKDIVDLDDNEALISLRAIQPKKYKYKDYYTRGGSEVYGFIAQQVEEVMPYATGTTTDYIPNILKKCNLHVNENGVCVITMKDNDPHGFTSDFNGKIKLFTETEDKIITMKEIINDYTLTINETLPEREYFMYGIEVDDFKILNKDAIFTTSVAAIQQLDRELQDTKQQLASAQTTINQLVSFIQTKFPGEFV